MHIIYLIYSLHVLNLLKKGKPEESRTENLGKEGNKTSGDEGKNPWGKEKGKPGEKKPGERRQKNLGNRERKAWEKEKGYPLSNVKKN